MHVYSHYLYPHRTKTMYFIILLHVSASYTGHHQMEVLQNHKSKNDFEVDYKRSIKTLLCLFCVDGDSDCTCQEDIGLMKI
jgi:hypothetical protein